MVANNIGEELKDSTPSSVKQSQTTQKEDTNLKETLLLERLRTASEWKILLQDTLENLLKQPLPEKLSTTSKHEQLKSD